MAMAGQRTKAKESLSVKLAADVAAFVANGGTIEPVDHTANQGFRAAHKGKQHIPMTVTPKPKQGDAWRVSNDGEGPKPPTFERGKHPNSLHFKSTK